MRYLRKGAPLALALGLGLVACNRTETVAPAPEAVSPEPPQSLKDAAFAREAYALKSKEKDQAKVVPALRELMSRYGYPALSREMSASESVPGGFSGALGKAAASSWTQVRSVNVIYHFAHTQLLSVPAGATLQATGAQVDGTSDPLIMGFYKTIGSGNASAYWIKFVGYNDDWGAGSLNSGFTWTNTTGASKSVRIVSWCYPETYGTTTMTFKITQNGRTIASGSRTMWVSGATEFYTRIPSDYAGCTGPLASQVELQRNRSNPATGFGSTLVAFDEGTMEGAFIRDTDYALQLNRPLKQGGSSFLMGYFQGDGYQPSSMDASDAIQKLDAHYHYPFYFVRQVDRFNCP